MRALAAELRRFLAEAPASYAKQVADLLIKSGQPRTSVAKWLTDYAHALVDDEDCGRSPQKAAHMLLVREMEAVVDEEGDFDPEAVAKVAALQASARKLR